MRKPSHSENLQKEHYARIGSEYAKHYGDPWSQRYRRQFINEPMLEGLDLSARCVLDAMCGSGETTRYLLERGARVTGVDISQKEIRQFTTAFPGCDAHCASILSTGLESERFDCVVVVGGLHHLHPRLREAVDEIHRVLKVGGYFCFAEPHKDSLPDQARRLWYRHDSLFAENEASLDIGSLKTQFSAKFDFTRENYKGNLAYLFVLNSLVFRIPLQFKRLYSPGLIGLEAMIGKMQGKRLSCFAVCQWRKL